MEKFDIDISTFLCILRFIKNYFVKSYSGWFVVKCRTKRNARSVGVEEFGRGMVNEVREATQNEVDSFVYLKGEEAMVVLD